MEDNLSVMVEATMQQLSSSLSDVAKQCAKEDSNMDNIVDQEMAVSTHTHTHTHTYMYTPVHTCTLCVFRRQQVQLMRLQLEYKRCRTTADRSTVESS